MLTKKLLKDRNFLLLMGYQLFVSLAHRMFLFGLPLLVYELTQSSSEMVFTFGITIAPHLIFSFFGGPLIDFFNRRIVLLITTALSCLMLCAFAVILIQGNSVVDLEWIYGVSFLLSSCHVFIMTTFDASLLDYFEKNEFIDVNSSTECILNGCNIIGPLLVGVLISWFGFKITIIAIAVFYVCSYILLSFSKPVHKTIVKKSIESLGDFLYEHMQSLKEGVTFIFGPGYILLFSLLITCLSNLILSPNDVLMTYIARNDLGMLPEDFASAMSICSLITLICLTILFSKLKHHSSFVIMIGVLLIDALCCTMIGVFQSKFIILGFFCMMLTSESMYNVFAKNLRQTVTPTHMIGRISGIIRSLSYCAAGIGTFLSGEFLHYITAKQYFAVSGILVLLITIFIYYLYKKYHRRLSQVFNVSEIIKKSAT